MKGAECRRKVVQRRRRDYIDRYGASGQRPEVATE